MKISDLVSDLSQLFGNMPAAQPSLGNSVDMQVVEPELEDHTEQETMIPPLQQKIELLKKAVDVDNVYDTEPSKSTGSKSVNLTLNVPPGQSSTKIELTLNSPDELDQIKQLAGVPAAAIFDAGDDEPLDS